MIIRVLREKLEAYTPNQMENFKEELAAAAEGKDMAALEAFCQRLGAEMAAKEGGAVAEYFKTGKVFKEGNI
jgi:hypothetical protein